MNQNISNQRSRAGRMKNFFTAHHIEIMPHADILAEITEFNNVLTQFDDFAVRQQQSITGFAEQKQEALDAAAEIVSKWGVRCHVKAENDGNLPLSQLLNHSVAEIVSLEDTDGLNLMKDIRDGLNDHIADFAMQGLTPIIITDITGKISAYEALINKPKEAISGRKMETEALEVLMKQVNEQLEPIVKLLQSVWTPDHPELIIEMMNNYRVDDLGHRYTGIEGTVVNSVPEGLANYKVFCKVGEDKIYESVSNLIGEYKIQSMKPGLYEFKLVNPAGSVVKTSIIKIERGVTLDYNWTV